MIRQLIRLVFLACAFYFILPMIPGIQFHGNFMHALGAGIFFTLLGWVVEWLAIVLSTVFAIGTLGAALLVLVPAWLLGFWLIPAVVLKLLADFMPGYLSVAGWWPAILGGLVMLFVGVISSGATRKCACS